MLRPSTFLLGRYPMLTFPMKGTRWCSQSENISMSLTTTISSVSSLKMPVLTALETESSYPDFTQNRLGKRLVIYTNVPHLS